MEATASDPDPFRPARDDREAVVERILDQLTARVDGALGGDREALIGLLLIAADMAWQSRAEVLGTVQEVAAEAHRFADEVADCYSDGRAPSDGMCDFGFALADRVDALAVEVLHLRARAGRADDAAIRQSPPLAGQEARHLARAHVAGLHDAQEAGRTLTDQDVEAAEDLYRAIVALARENAGRMTRAGLTEAT